MAMQLVMPWYNDCMITTYDGYEGVCALRKYHGLAGWHVIRRRSLGNLDGALRGPRLDSVTKCPHYEGSASRWCRAVIRNSMIDGSKFICYSSQMPEAAYFALRSDDCV
jgi:hypothetical protein